MADPKFDPAAHAAQARQLAELASEARAALRTDTVERTSRLGQERDDAARRAYGADQEAAATVQQVKRELAAAEELDDQAAIFERQAADMEQRGVDRGTAEMAADLREQAAEQRALAEAARNRAHDASADGDRLRQEAIDQRAKVEQLESDLAAEPKRREQLEEAVDNLEFNASEATYTADQARHAAELDSRAESAAARGDRAAADAARAQAAKIRDDISQRGQNRELFTPAADQLGQLGITVPTDLLTPPGFAVVSSIVDPPDAASDSPQDAAAGAADQVDPDVSGDPGVVGDVDVVTGQLDDTSTDTDADSEAAADTFTAGGELVGADSGVGAAELSGRVMSELFDGVTGDVHSEIEVEPFNATADEGVEPTTDIAADPFDASASGEIVTAEFDAPAEFSEG